MKKNIDLWFEKYLSLDPYTFDQSESWWRWFEKNSIRECIFSNFENKSKTYDLINLLKFYLENYKFNNTNKRHKRLHNLMRFHIWQIYAQILEYDNAIMYFSKLQEELYDGVWKNYLDFTIAFLQWDELIMKNIVSIMQVDEINYEVVCRMYNKKDLSYIEAYFWENINHIKNILNTW